MNVENNKIEYLKEVQHFSISHNKSITITCNNTLQYSISKNLQWECKFLDILPIDYLETCLISKSIILQVHSTLIFLNEKREISDIIQLDSEIHSVYALNDYDAVGIFLIIDDTFQIYNPKLVQNYQFFSKKCMQFDTSISFQPFRLSCFATQSSIYFILVRNLEHSRYYQRELECKDIIISICKCRDRLIIVGKSNIYTILISTQENTVSEEQFMGSLNICQASYPNALLNGNAYHSNDDFLFRFDDSAQVGYFKLLYGGTNRIESTKHKEKILEFDYINQQIVVYSQLSKYYLTIYNDQFHQLFRYEFNKHFEMIKYCPFFKGIMICEQKIEYLDKEPNNNYILMTEAQQQTFLQLIDFHTKIYRNEKQQNTLISYLLHGKSAKSISCGFMMDYPVSKLQNIWGNRFILTSTYKIKVVEIYNDPYEMATIFEFGVLNQQLVTFRSSLPLEDLERIDFLKQTEQRILFSYWGQAKCDSQQFFLTGIIHSVYGVKWIKITNDNATVSSLASADMRIQRVLQEGRDFFYFLCNDEEVYKITEKEVKLIYISGSKLSWYVSRGMRESVILKGNREILVTEFENPQKIRYSLQL